MNRIEIIDKVNKIKIMIKYTEDKKERLHLIQQINDLESKLEEIEIKEYKSLY